jgi:hypothetical protein
MQRFWGCIHVRRAWEFTNKIINWFMDPACPGTLFQCIGMQHFRCYRTEAVSQSGCVVRGIIFRVIWIERNDEIFNDQKWHPQNVESVVWKSRVAWGRCLWIDEEISEC